MEKTFWRAKIQGFLNSVRATTPIIGQEAAIAQARRIGQETMDSAQLAEAEARCREKRV